MGKLKPFLGDKEILIRERNLERYTITKEEFRILLINQSLARGSL